MEKLPRLTLKEIGQIISKFFYFDKGVIYTFIHFIRWPYQTIKKYFEVDRMSIIHPLRYLIFGVAIDIIINKFHPTVQSTLEEVRNDNLTNASFRDVENKYGFAIGDAMNQANNIYMDYQKPYFLLIVPLLSIITYLAFKKKYNFAENLVINTYAFGTMVWISVGLLLVTLPFTTSRTMIEISNTISAIVLIYLYKKMYQATWIRSITSTFIVLGVAFLIGMVFQLVVAFIIVLKAT